MNNEALQARASPVVVVGVLALFLASVGAVGVVVLTPDSDPLWAAVASAVGCVLLASSPLVALVVGHLRHASAAELHESIGAGTMAATVACGLLFGLGVRGHRPALTFTCLALAIVLGYGPRLLVRRRRVAH